MEADAVTALSYKSGDENVSLVKKDGTWYDAEDESFPLNQKFLETMVNKTAQLKAQRYVGNGDKAFSSMDWKILPMSLPLPRRTRK